MHAGKFYLKKEISRPKIKVFVQSIGTCILRRQLPNLVRYADLQRSHDETPATPNMVIMQIGGGDNDDDDENNGENDKSFMLF